MLKFLSILGRWRALVKHVSEDKLVLIRFARGFDVRRGVMYNPPIHLEEESHDPGLFLLCYLDQLFAN